MLRPSNKAAFFGILLPVLCAAQTTPAAPPEEPASVAGMVTNSITGGPILRSHIVLRSAGGNRNPEMNSTYGALSNAEGKFTITRLPPGPYSVSADRVGFVMTGQGGAIRPLTFTLAPGEKKADLKLTLTPTGAITGRVLDASGEPAPGVMVQPIGGGGGQSTTTDEQGRYRLGGLRPGKYRVRATPQQGLPFGNEIRTDGTSDVHQSATYYPVALSRASAQRLDVQPAIPLTGIDIRLVNTAIVSVSGKVSGIPEGSVRTSIQVMRESEDNWGGPENVVKADGTFHISHLDPGKYTLTAVSLGKGGPQRNVTSAPVEVEIAGTDIEHLELRMIPPFEIRGQVRFDEERIRLPQPPPQPPGQTAARQSSASIRRIRLESAGTGFMGQSVNAEIGDDDAFTLEKVPPGRYHVALSWGPGYVKSVSVGPTETEGDLLDVRNGPAAAVMVSVSGLTCEISGVVSGPDGPAAGTRVILSPATGDPRFMRVAPAKPDGTYAFTGLPPGKYKLAASDDDSYTDLMQPGVPMEDDAAAEIIDLRPGDKTTKDLKRK